jgi:PIN domain nuclease of toxin-antitoxin system
MAGREPMNVLLDTCALLALVGNVDSLSKPASQALASASLVFVSPIIAWEIAIKVKSGKLRMKVPVQDWYRDSLERYHLQEIPLSAESLCAAADLPSIHRDPFDRVMIAIAMERNLPILTSDRTIPKYTGIHVIW